MSKDKDKYEWKTNEAPPTIEQHSIKKHELIKEYIILYIKTLMLNPRIPEIKLSIIDGFAGGGVYTNIKTQDIHYGSPVVILEALKEALVIINQDRDKPRKIIFDLYLVENNQQIIEYLKDVIRNKFNSNIFERINFINCDFTKSLPNIISNIKQRNSRERALFILDQYAYKDVPITSLNQYIFSQLKNPEVILTFNIGSLSSFLADTKSNRKALGNLGIEHFFPWEEFREYNESEHRNAFIRTDNLYNG